MDYKNLSIVISSHLSKEENDKFTQHLKNTIDIKDYEILLYENFNQYSLTEIYNIGLNESKYDIVLFIHNDIFFNTKNWGKILLNKFSKTEYGILGIAGTTDLNEDGIWWSDSSKMVGIVNHKYNNKTFESKYSNSYGKEIIEVVAVDGLFIAVNKNKICKGFIENFKGFHYYDISFCIENYLKGVKIGVMFDISIIHNSIGETNIEFEKNKFKFIAKYDKELPINLNINEIKEVNYKPIKLKNNPLVSIIIPHKNNNKILFNLLDSIKYKTTYNNYKIYIADTGSELCEIYEINKYIKECENIELIKYDYYNFAKINNDVVKNYIDKNTDLLLFLNNDIIFINDIITVLVDTYNKNNNVGTIGARLYYKNNSIQHSGIILTNRKNKLYLSHYGIRSYYKYYKDTVKNVFGNTAACMMTSYKLFTEIGMFKENYLECFEDVQYNIDCLLNNRYNIFAGNAVGYHLESQTRNLDKKKNEKMLIDYQTVMDHIKNNYKIIEKYVAKVN